MATNNFKLKVQAVLDKVKSIANIKADIKAIELKLPKIRIQGTLNMTSTRKELSTKLKSIKPKVKVDADTAQAEKKIKKMGEKKAKTTITPIVDTAQVESGLKQVENKTKGLWTRFKEGIIGTNLIRMSIQKVTEAAFEAVRAVKELDAIKANIQIVSGISDSEADALMSSYNVMAKELSSTTRDIAEAAGEFLQMGESITDTDKLIYSSQVLSKVGMIESSKAASYLVSSLKGYQIAAADAIDIVSKLTSVDQEAGISAGGLAEAISMCADSANSSGISMDRLIGYAAAVGEAAQGSMSAIGNNLNAIFGRINNIKIGRFIDDESSDSLSDMEDVLNDLGIRLRDTAAAYRDFDDVLSDIGTRWEEFSQTERDAISVAVAGMGQRNQFLALMDNWENAMKYTEAAAYSAGSAMERFGVYQDSIGAKSNELTAAMESLSTNVVSEELYSGIIQAATGIVEFLDKTNLLKTSLLGLMAMGVSKAISSIAAGFMAAAKSTARFTAVMAMFKKGKSEENLNAIGMACKGLSNKQLKLVLSTKGLKEQERKLILTGMGVAETEHKQMLATLGLATAEDKVTLSTFSLKGAFMSLGRVMAMNPVGSIMMGISVAAMIFTGYRRVIEDMHQKTKELGEEIKSTKSDIEDFKSKIDEIYKAINSSDAPFSEVVEARKRLMDVQDELIVEYGSEKEAIDSITKAVNGETSALNALEKMKWAETKNKLNDAGFWNGILNWLDGFDTNIDRMVGEMTNARVILPFYYDDLAYGEFDDLTEQMRKLGWTYQDVSHGFVKTGNLEELYLDLLKIQNLTKDMNAPDMFLNELIKAFNKARETMDSYSDLWNTYVFRDIILENEKLTQSWNDLNEAYSEYAKAFETGNKDIVNIAIEKYSQVLDSALDIPNNYEYVKEYFRKMYPVLTNESEKWTFRFKVLPNYDLHSLKGKTQADILEMLQTDGIQYGEQTFESLLRLADKYGIVIGSNTEKIKRLLDLLVEWEIIPKGTTDDSTMEEPRTSIDFIAKSKDSLDKFQSAVKSASDAYTTLLSGSYSSSSLLDSIQKINQAASDLGESIDWDSVSASDNPLQYIEDMLESVSKTYADSVLNDAGVNTDSKLGRILVNIIQESYNSEARLLSLNTQVDSLQSAYESLTDIIATYNDAGYITFDQLQTILAMGPQYLSCLADENGQLMLNQEALIALANMRLDDAESQAIQQTMTELGKLAFEEEQIAVENNTEAFSNAVDDLDMYNESLLDTITMTNVAASETWKLNAAVNGAKAKGAAPSQIDAILANLKTKLQLIRATRDGINKNESNYGKIVGKTSTNSSASGKSESTESIDYFTRRAEVLNDTLSLIKDNIDNISGSAIKNTLIDTELGILGEKFRNYSDAAAMYTEKANEAFSKLPSDVASKVREGAVALTDYLGDDNKNVVKAAKDYESWAGKIVDCKKELAKLKKEIRQLELDKFNNIMEDFKDQFDLRDAGKDLLAKQVNLLKESGELVGESFFQAQLDQSGKQLDLLEEEKARLVSRMSDALGSGRVQEGTDEWLEMVKAISEVDGSIFDCKKNMEELDDSILNIHTEIFDRIIERFSGLDSEISNILDLLDDFDASNEKGIWTNEGIARLGLLAQQYELAEYQVRKYNEEIDELNQQYLAGKYSATEYADRLAELSSAQWDSVKSAESAKDAVWELNEIRVENEVKGIEKEIEAYDALTQAQLNTLKASKELHDYENSVSEKTKTINDLERRIAAMSNDTSASTVAGRRRLEQELEEARKELEEAEYGHSVEARENALTKQLEDYGKERNKEIESLRETLENREAVIAASFETVKANASVIGQEIAEVAVTHGITVSNALISSWQSGANAVAGYGMALSQGTSAFIGNVMGVENEVWNLQTQANAAADTMAWMFAAKADNLVAELASSYISESALAEMTNVLHQCLVETLEGGYDISGIVSSLNDITNAANEAAHAISGLGGSGNKEAVRNKEKKYSGGKNGGGMTTGGSMAYTQVIYRYAGGTRSSKGNIIITDEEGYEMKLPKLGNGRYTIADEGTQIFTKEQTDNLYELSKVGLNDLAPLKSLTADMAQEVWRKSGIPQPVVNRRDNPLVNVHYDSMVTVNGDVNDTDHFIKQVARIADKSAVKVVDNFKKRINDMIIYGR